MGDDHQELEAIGRQKWEQAKVNLELATMHFHEICEVADVPQEDYQRSLDTLFEAASEYQRVQRIYTDLKVHGKIPA